MEILIVDSVCDVVGNHCIELIGWTDIAVDKFVRTGKGLKPLVPESLNVLTALASAMSSFGKSMDDRTHPSDHDGCDRSLIQEIAADLGEGFGGLPELVDEEFGAIAQASHKYPCFGFGIFAHPNPI